MNKTKICKALGLSRQSSAITKTLFKKSNSSTTLGNMAQINDSDIEDDSETEDNSIQNDSEESSDSLIESSSDSNVGTVDFSDHDTDGY